MPSLTTQIVAVATMKGGSGKTTMSVCLAAQWMQQGFATALIDADPQRSALRWVRSGTDLAGLKLLTLSGPKGEDVGPMLAELRRAGYQRVVVDTPGFRSPVITPILQAAELALIPIKASPLDFEVAADTVDIIRGHASSRPADRPLVARFVLTQTIPRSVVARHMRAELVEANYALLEAELPNRVAHAEAPFSGSTPSLIAPTGVAARETAALVAEVEGLLTRGRTDG